MMGLAALAARAVLKGAGSLLDSLTDEQRQRLQREVTELSAAIKTTTVALAAQHANKEAQERRTVVLHPPTIAVIACTVVQELRDSGRLTAEQLAKHVGTAVEDVDFEEALNVAIADGRIIAPALTERDEQGALIRNDDELLARTAAIILEPHPLVRATGQVNDFRLRIVEAIYEVGAATLNELRAALGVGDTASADMDVAFEAGLEEALAQGLIEWVGRPSKPSLYTVPRDKMENLWKEDGKPNLVEARGQLGDAVKALMHELAALQSAEAPGGADAPRSASTISTPLAPNGTESRPKPPIPGPSEESGPDSADS
jgi:hypothetical protein